MVSTENLKRATYSDITLSSLSCSRSASTGTISGSWSGTIIGSWSGSQRFVANKQVLRLAHSKCLKSHSCASGMPSTWPSFFSELSYKFRCMVSSQVFKNIFKDSTETDQNRWSYLSSQKPTSLSYFPSASTGMFFADSATIGSWSGLQNPEFGGPKNRC